MTHGDELYLALILAAFLSYAVTLFWSMVSSNGGPNTEPSHIPRDH